MRSAHRYFDWQSTLAKPWLGKRVLAIGRGMGNFTRTILVGVDVEADFVARHRENRRDYGNVVSLKLMLRIPIPRRRSVPMLEHIEDDRQTRRNLWKILPDGGRVVLIAPAFQGLYGPIDRLLGHYRRYSKRSIRDMANATGFEPVERRYLKLAGFFGWWANAKVFKRTGQSAAQIAAFDKLIVPWLRPLESGVPPPGGRNVFTALEERAAR